MGLSKLSLTDQPPNKQNWVNEWVRKNAKTHYDTGLIQRELARAGLAERDRQAVNGMVNRAFASMSYLKGSTLYRTFRVRMIQHGDIGLVYAS